MADIPRYLGSQVAAMVKRAGMPEILTWLAAHPEVTAGAAAAAGGGVVGAMDAQPGHRLRGAALGAGVAGLGGYGLGKGLGYLQNENEAAKALAKT